MIWIIIFVIIIFASAILAWRSMRGYQELPVPELNHSLFLIRNTKALNADFLTLLHSFVLEHNTLVSLERLHKGADSALVIFGPTHLPAIFKDLDLIELEDYLNPIEDNTTLKSVFDQKKVFVDQSLPWIIQPKNNPKKQLTIKPEFLKVLDLNQNQRFFWQIALSPIKDQDFFQVTIRAMVVDPEPVQRVELLKKVDRQIQSGTGLTKQQAQPSTPTIYQSFINRSLVPKEISAFLLTKDEILRLLKVG